MLGSGSRTCSACRPASQHVSDGDVCPLFSLVINARKRPDDAMWRPEGRKHTLMQFCARVAKTKTAEAAAARLACRLPHVSSGRASVGNYARHQATCLRKRGRTTTQQPREAGRGLQCRASERR